MSADIINLPPPRRPTISLPDGAAHAINMLRYEIGQLKTRKRVKTEPLIGWLGLMAGNSGVPPNNNSERTVVLGFRVSFPWRYISGDGGEALWCAPGASPSCFVEVT